MSSINEIADDYVSRFSALNPIAATSAGISGHDDLMPDLSPAGFDAITDLSKATLAAITRTQAADAREQTAKEAMIERLTIGLERYDIGDITADVNVVASWVQGVRQVFDLMPTESDESRQNVIARMRQVPAAYQGLRRTYLEAAARGHVAPRRQVLACAKQCAEWSAADSGFYYELARRLASTGTASAELDRAAELASAGTAEFGRFLETELLPIATERDAVGRDRFALASRYFLGATIDAGEAYAWGWSEVIRIG
ncbi:MAG TPA: DUF885 family protein, partial [Streptosporangiaceae bacterium]|nr:DUF885 family protein [Streptosporangiaceae bacterium]